MAPATKIPPPLRGSSLTVVIGVEGICRRREEGVLDEGGDAGGGTAARAAEHPLDRRRAFGADL